MEYHSKPSSLLRESYKIGGQPRLCATAAISRDVTYYLTPIMAITLGGFIYFPCEERGLLSPIHYVSPIHLIHVCVGSPKLGETKFTSRIWIHSGGVSCCHICNPVSMALKLQVDVLALWSSLSTWIPGVGSHLGNLHVWENTVSWLFYWILEIVFQTSTLYGSRTINSSCTWVERAAYLLTFCVAAIDPCSYNVIIWCSASCSRLVQQFNTTSELNLTGCRALSVALPSNM